MKKQNKKLIESKEDAFYMVLSLILIGLAIYVSIKTGKFLVAAVIKVADKYPTIMVALITGLLAFISTIIGRILENRFMINNQIRKERQEVYIVFLDWLINNVLNAEINDNKNATNELKEQQKKMTIYASDNVLKEWSEFKYVAMNSILNNPNLSPEEKTRHFIKNEAPYIEKLILAIRKELGYKNKNIKQYDILKLYINDLNEFTDL